MFTPVCYKCASPIRNNPHNALCEQENNITQKKEACKREFEIDDGPFCIALDKALGDFDVYRQAYYGGTFNGNQAHKCLQVCCTKTMVKAAHVHVCQITHVGEKTLPLNRRSTLLRSASA